MFIGLDGGSTSTKAVALTPDGDVLAASYRFRSLTQSPTQLLSFEDLRGQSSGPEHPRAGSRMGTTGYSKDLLKKVLSADVALVETVAHAKSSLRLFPEVDAIIDVGGQDIKIIVLQDGDREGFQAEYPVLGGQWIFPASGRGSARHRIEDFAEIAFQARRMPEFSYGCAVFLQSDIVNFQRQGWRPEEILAGLATVLPKNVFLYVAGSLQRRQARQAFHSAGRTQRNLAVVKAEVDFIREHYHGEGSRR